MSEFLTVRLSSEQHQSVPWVVWSTSQQEVIASGELPNVQHLEELVSYAEKRSIIVLLSASDVMMTQVNVPAGGARQFDAMLPYLVEDESAQDVEELHFTTVNKSGGLADVIALDHHLLENILAHFKALGLEVKKVLPDCLALPLHESALSAVDLGEQWLVRHSQYQGAAPDGNWMPIYLAALSEEKPVTVYSYSDLPIETGDVEWIAEPAEMPMALLARGAIGSKVNLLTGSFKAPSSLLKYRKIWQKVAVAAGLLLVSLFIQQALMLKQIEQEASAYRAERDRIFREVLPGKRKIPTVSYLKRSLNDEAKRLAGGGNNALMLTWLAELPATLGTVKGMELLSIKYDGGRNEMRLQARSKDFQTFESVRLKLAEDFQVEQGQLNRSGETVVGSFVLTAK